MSYNLDWRGWPQGWDRSAPFRVINFLGKTSADTYQNVYAANGRIIYLCRRGDTGVLEIRFVRHTAYAYATPDSALEGTARRQNVWHDAWVDWPTWRPRKGEYVPNAWRAVVRQALQITNI